MPKITCILILLCMFIFGCAKPSTIISFNIRYENKWDKDNGWNHRKQEIVRFIENYNPDILGVQEGSKRTVTFLTEALPKYQFIGIGANGKTGGEYTAILYNTSKYNVINSNTFWLSETPNKSSKGWDAAGIKICTYGAFIPKKGKDTLHIFNTHFDHRGHKSKEKAAELILKKIDEFNLAKKNVIVMGDLNSRPTDKGIKAINKVLDDAIEISKTPLTGPKGTFNFFNKTYKPAVRIDYIFTKNLKVLSYKHLDDKRENGLWLSDHLPVLIEIK